MEARLLQQTFMGSHNEDEIGPPVVQAVFKDLLVLRSEVVGKHGCARS
jgi:hypothetical protein